MNKQNPGIEWTHRYGPHTGYTWNPLQGCDHDCQWRMPDGTIAGCYAKAIAEKFKSASFFPQGFEQHYWHPSKLDEPLKLTTPAGIFLDSMSDLMSRRVPEGQIEQVLEVCRRAHWHTFFLLTKNAPRLRQFQFPPNVWVGASAPPTFMYGKELDLDQQRRMLGKTLDILATTDVPVRWLSIEPLSFDVSSVLTYAHIEYGQAIQWAVIGAATNGAKVYQPHPHLVRRAIEQLREMGAAIFFKGNLRGNAAAAVWLEEFPAVEETR